MKKKIDMLIKTGNYLWHQGHLDLAIDSFTKAIEVDPTNAFVYDKRGIIYGELGEYHKSFHDHDMAIQINDRFAGAYCNRGLCYYKESMYTEALADYNRAIELSPDIAIFFYNRGLVYYHQGNIEKAICDYNEAFEINDDIELASEILNFRGEAFNKLGNNELAESNFDLAMIFNSNNIDAYANKAALSKVKKDKII